MPILTLLWVQFCLSILKLNWTPFSVKDKIDFVIPRSTILGLTYHGAIFNQTSFAI